MDNRVLHRDKASYPLPGHRLMHNGAPHNNKGERLDLHNQVVTVTYNTGASGEGRALCECGELSDPLPSRNKRAAWHRKHKDQIRNT